MSSIKVEREGGKGCVSVQEPGTSRCTVGLRGRVLYLQALLHPEHSCSTGTVAGRSAPGTLAQGNNFLQCKTQAHRYLDCEYHNTNRCIASHSSTRGKVISGHVAPLLSLCPMSSYLMGTITVQPLQDCFQGFKG